MEGEHHALSKEFPEYVEKIHYLKLSNAHFKKLCEKYEEVDKAVARSESRIDALSEEAEKSLREERLKIKDEIYETLKA